MRLTGCFSIAVFAGCGTGQSTTVDSEPASDADTDTDSDADSDTDTDVAPVDPFVGIGALELVSSGFIFIEGPIWRPVEEVLLFSDIPENTIFQLDPPSAISVFRAASNESNGLENGIDGSLLAAEHRSRRVSRTTEDGIEVVADDYQGDQLHSPNDLAVRSDGTIFFTDPPYGNNPSELDFNGVFRVQPDGTITAEWEGESSTRPNGIRLSPDETTLYVSDTESEVVRSYAVAADGTLSGEAVFADTDPVPDGMAVDNAGNLYVSTSAGIEVYAPDGSLWGVIEVPDNRPANCAFGETDGKTLYITAQDSLYRVVLEVSGRVW